MEHVQTAAAQLPFAQEHPLAVPKGLRDLLADGPIHRVHTAVGDEAWLVTGYAEVRQLLTDQRLGRSHPNPDRAARTGESALFGGPLGNYDTEDVDHARMRALLQPHFTPKHMRALQPRIEELTTRLLDELADQDQPADLHAALALPLPILVICELLGVPYEDRDRFREWTQAAGNVRDRTRSEHGLGQLFGYGQELVARKRAEPGDDVITRLSETEGVSDEEAAAMSMALLFAGHETTVVAIGTGALLLLVRPERWQALVDDPALASKAVEEILRVPGKGGNGIPRYARTDLEIGGVPIRAGELMLLDTGAANHDPAVFTDPDHFNPHRRAAHVTFGYGPRYCIGAPLARIELTTVIGQLTHRFPTMRLSTPVEQLSIRRAGSELSLTRARRLDGAADVRCVGVVGAPLGLASQSRNHRKESDMTADDMAGSNHTVRRMRMQYTASTETCERRSLIREHHVRIVVGAGSELPGRRQRPGR